MDKIPIIPTAEEAKRLFEFFSPSASTISSTDPRALALSDALKKADAARAVQPEDTVKVVERAEELMTQQNIPKSSAISIATDEQAETKANEFKSAVMRIESLLSRFPLWMKVGIPVAGVGIVLFAMRK